MRIRKTYAIVSIFVLICSVIILVNPFKEKVWDLNSKLLRKEVLSLEQTDKRINLSRLTPFQWDRIYSFSPYTSKEEIYKALGYKWDYACETLNEGMDNVIFTKDKEVVCYLSGYPFRNGYSISFYDRNSKNGVGILRFKDNLNFNVRKCDNVIYLEKIR
ncbi:MAG: hypothetical protein N4A57_15430 [Anaeromicrobium sp.]|jgi:hypothetical protein|uniref:hypothetical protein n=1 Tax=Anaeromicrobium sp. TaxID=1929132 RepID=UPI0025DB7327|nr:hypothetical protein [Anaeromicrobium sp.]MCT4595639.1 hypothetical protein [Anaeromicrobium sp.]